MAISSSRDVTYHEHRLGSTALVLWWIAYNRVCSSRSSRSCDNPPVLPPYRCIDGTPTLLLVLRASGPPYSHLPCTVGLWLCILVRYQGRLKENNNGNQNFRQLPKDNKIYCKNHGRRSCWLATLDLEKRDPISYKILRTKTAKSKDNCKADISTHIAFLIKGNSSRDEISRSCPCVLKLIPPTWKTVYWLQCLWWSMNVRLLRLSWDY